ncbi:MAG TPA: cyclic pyranopterin monophosphate synthase MoaC [Polyangiaceae bacterium]|nr:cyclic pyranopterin monophosphate synthase MoaC [Polyangiaceae bacterium]
MKLYRFDGVDQTFDLLPLSARRALDHAGCKLSLEGFRSLPAAERLALSELGSAELVDVERVKALLLAAQPPPQSIPAVADPSPVVPDDAVVAAFGAARPIPAASWSALSPLDRYALAKVARGKSPERIQQAYAEIVGQSAFSSHIAPDGGVRMVGVGGKQPSLRRAEAQSRVTMNAEAFERASNRDAPKGDVLGTARVAAIMGAKRTSELIPLCHPLSLTKVDVQLSLDAPARAIDVAVVVECFDRTGVEMEALTAASVAALTVYDMLKAFDRGMEIGPTRLTQKSGGRSGDFQR